MHPIMTADFVGSEWAAVAEKKAETRMFAGVSGL
jgi:hypothetical protein